MAGAMEESAQPGVCSHCFGLNPTLPPLAHPVWSADPLAVGPLSVSDDPTWTQRVRVEPRSSRRFRQNYVDHLLTGNMDQLDRRLETCSVQASDGSREEDSDIDLDVIW